MAFYDAIPASDGTSLTAPSNAEFKVFEVTDTARANPLPLRTVAGLNAAPLVTTTQGVVPPVDVVSPNFEHIFKSGEWEWRRESTEGIKRAALDAQESAAEAVTLVKMPTDQAVDAGIDRADIPGTVAKTVAAQPTVAAAAAAAVDANPKIAELSGAMPWKGRMPNATDVNSLTTPGVYLIATQTAADSMINLAAKEPGIFTVEGQASASSIIFSQTQKTYGAAPKRFERITRASGPVWNAWEKTWPIASTAPVATSDVGLANKAWLDAFIQARGGSIGTGGVAAVSIRVDHGAVNFRDKILPKARERNIPISFAINPGQARLDLPESAGVTWEQYNSWALNDGVEFANHGMGHVDATTTAEMQVELVDSKALLQSKLPNCTPEIFAIAGVSGTDMNGWTAASSPEHFYNYEAGRLVLANHAVTTGYVPGKLRPLTGTPVNGATHYSIDGITAASTVIGVIKDAQAMGAGLQLMLHPSQVDLPGKITTTVLHEVMDYLANERDAGRLLLLTMGGLFLADTRSQYRHNLLANGSFNGLTGWVGPGTWVTNGSYARTTTTDAGMLTQTVALSDRKWAVGRVRELSAQFRSSSGGVARISVTHAGTGLNVVKDVTVPAGSTWATVSAFFTIPATAGSINVSVGRVSGDVMDIQKCAILSA